MCWHWYVLQDTLTIFYFKALPTKNIPRHWRVFASNFLYTVLFKDFQCLDLYNSVIANKAIWSTTKKWELRVDPKSCIGYSCRCGNFTLQYGFWFTFKAIALPVRLKMIRSKTPTLVGNKLVGFNGSIWLGLTNKLLNFESTETLGRCQPAPAFTESSLGFAVLLCCRYFHKGFRL